MKAPRGGASPWALLSLIVGGLLLMWPIDVALWDLPGVFGGGTPEAGGADLTTPLGALIGGRPLGDVGDRMRLALGLILVGVGFGVGMMTATGHRRDRHRQDAAGEVRGRG